MKLRREPGADGKGVVLKNVKYFNAVENDGFQLYRSMEHRAGLEGHQFSYSDRKAFVSRTTRQSWSRRSTKGPIERAR